MKKYVERIVQQLHKMSTNLQKEKQNTKKWIRFLDYEKPFEQDGDLELTDEQKKEILSFWGKYKFAYPLLNFNAFKVYMNRCGKFDCKNLPGGIRGSFVAPFLQNKKYYSHNNKALLYKLLPNIKQPNLILTRMNGVYYDPNYQVISLEKAIDMVLKYLETDKEIVFKISESQGGSGVRFYDRNVLKNSIDVKKIFQSTASTIVVQEAIKQHTFMNNLNSSSVNSIRITTVIWDNEVVITASLIRVGAQNNRVDNVSSGGCMIGVDDRGILCDFAIGHNGEHIYELPSGFNLKNAKELKVPSYDKVIELVKTAQMQLPYTKLVSWDIAIDDGGVPILIELNFSGSVDIHQCVTGPVYGELTEKILDECILKRYFKRHSTYSYDFKEFYDHIEIEKYVGWSKKVIIPEMFKKKPITVIGDKAFLNNVHIEKVVLPDNISLIKKKSFFGCKRLKEININDNTKVSSSAFGDTALEKKR